MRKRFAVLVSVLAVTLGVVTIAAAEEEPKPATTVDASKGGFTIQSGDNSLTFSTYVHVRLSVDDRDEIDLDPVGSTGNGIADGTAASFDVPRLRMWIRGSMWKAWLKYNFSWDFSRTAGESDIKFKDAFIEFAQKPAATVRWGQFKVPFSLQELTPDQFQLFLDRGITNTAFAPGRDFGAMLTGTTESKKFGYGVGLFNGSGESRRQEDEKLMYAARVWFDPLGEYKLLEGTTDNPEKNIFHVGVAYRGGEATKAPDTCPATACPPLGGTIFEDPDNQDALNVELAWKYRRLFATGEYFAQTTENKNPAPATPDVDATGWHAQFAVMAVPQRLEIGLRYMEVDPNDSIDLDKQTESRLVANYFMRGQNIKLQFELGEVEYEALNPLRGVRLATAAGQTVKDRQARIQAQLFF